MSKRSWSMRTDEGTLRAEVVMPPPAHRAPPTCDERIDDDTGPEGQINPLAHCGNQAAELMPHHEGWAAQAVVSEVAGQFGPTYPYGLHLNQDLSETGNGTGHIGHFHLSRAMPH